MSSEVVDLTLELPPSPEDRFLASFLAELHERIPASKDELQQLKRRIARSHGVAGIPSDSDVLGRLPLPIRDELVDLLRIKPARTASGVAVVTVMTAPHACPHGVCPFCPGGPGFGTPPPGASASRLRRCPTASSGRRSTRASRSARPVWNSVFSRPTTTSSRRCIAATRMPRAGPHSAERRPPA